MDTTIFEFTSIDDMLFDAFCTSKEYMEFCSNLDKLEELSSYDEGMTYDDTRTSLKSDIYKIGRNTWDTTKDVAKIYKYATDNKAKTYKGLWDLFIRLLQLITKVIAFIWNLLGRLPVYLLRLVDWITHLPTRIVNKIKGNIELYITIDDLKNIYSVDLFENIGIILKDAKVMMNGDFWTNWKNQIHFKGMKVNKHIEIPVLAKDPGTNKAVKEIIKIYESKLSKIRFVKSIIDLGREDNVNLYFRTKEITITKRSGASNTGSYLDLINGLITDMKDKQTEIQEVSKSVSENLQGATTEDGFLSLSASDRTAIYRATQCLSGTINILGNIVKYANKDIQTIDNARKRISKKTGEKSNENEEKANNSRINKVSIDELQMSDIIKWFKEKLTSDKYSGVIYTPKEKKNILMQVIYDKSTDKIVQSREITYSSLNQKLQDLLDKNNGKFVIDPPSNQNSNNIPDTNDAWKQLNQNKKRNS